MPFIISQFLWVTSLGTARPNWVPQVEPHKAEGSQAAFCSRDSEHEPPSSLIQVVVESSLLKVSAKLEVSISFLAVKWGPRSPLQG